MYSPTKDEAARNLKSSAHNIQESARETMQEVRGDMREVANRAGQKMRTFINTAGDEITHATDAVSRQIRTKPMQSSLIALGAGFVLGMLFRR